MAAEAALTETGRRVLAAASTTPLLLALLALGLAPLAMPASYHWLANSISESGAQQLPGAWVARAGFLLFGLGVVLVAILRHGAWGRWATPLLVAFGMLMMACAAFSTRQWIVDAPFDPTENALHSAAATVMGFCYGIGLVLVLIHDRAMGAGRRVLTIAGAVSSVVLPIGVGMLPEVGGVLQRLMFAIAFAWFLVEVRRGD